MLTPLIAQRSKIRLGDTRKLSGAKGRFASRFAKRGYFFFFRVFFRRCPSTVSCTVPSRESANSRWIPTWEPNQQSNCLKALLMGISLSEYGSEGFRVRLTRLSEYISVAYLVERPTRETQAEQYSDTVPVFPEKSWRIHRKRPFVHNSVCSQFLEGLFASLAARSQFSLRSFQ